MHIDVSFLPALGATFLLIFARTGTMIMLLPGIGEQGISPRMRLTIALILAAVLVPLHRNSYHIDPARSGPAIVLVVEEIFIGAVLGLTARLTISALEVAGSVIAQQLGLGFVTAVDPSQGEQGMIISNFLTMLAITLFFATDMHHLVLAALNDSYTLFEPGEVPSTGDVAALVTQDGVRRLPHRHPALRAVSGVRALVQSRARRAVAADAGDAGLFPGAAALDPDRLSVPAAGARRDDGTVSRLCRPACCTTSRPHA